MRDSCRAWDMACLSRTGIFLSYAKVVGMPDRRESAMQVPSARGRTRPWIGAGLEAVVGGRSYVSRVGAIRRSCWAVFDVADRSDVGFPFF